MSSENVYCRLCAETKHIRKLVDLQSDLEKRREIINKLTRVNAPAEFIDTKLPSTVCLVCLRALDKCFEFVVRVECAQNILGDILASKNVKTEFSDQTLATDEHSEGEAPLAYEVKHVDVKTELIQEDLDEAEVKTPLKPKKIKKSDSLDSVPLSQLKQKQSWADYNWLCTCCKTRFENIGDLQVHSMAVHSICNPYRCSHCKIRKQCLDQFLIHIQRHNKELKRSCYKCFLSSKTVSSAQKHRKTHIDTEFSCPGCNTTFETSDELKLHKETYYDFKMHKKSNIPQTTAINGKTCLICSKTFKHKANVKIHILRMHTERQPDHICDVCGKAFFDKFNHAQHMLFVHTDYRPHKCHICKLSFKTPKSLKDHTGRHFNEKPLACDKCGKNFRLQKHLAKHSIIHTDKLPFQCSYCDKRFQRKQYLTNHLLQHTGEKPYSCEPCQQHFASWGNYNKHMICRHNQDTARKKAVLVDEL